jgi:hypothetical protein
MELTRCIFDSTFTTKVFASPHFINQLSNATYSLTFYFCFLASFVRFGSTTPSTTTKDSKVVLEDSIPGFREPGVVATDYEVAAGLERYELLKALRGEDPWEDLHPINITAKGTVKNPIIVRGLFIYFLIIVIF